MGVKNKKERNSQTMSCRSIFIGIYAKYSGVPCQKSFQKSLKNTNAELFIAAILAYCVQTGK